MKDGDYNNELEVQKIQYDKESNIIIESYEYEIVDENIC